MLRAVSGFVAIAGILAASAAFLDHKTARKEDQGGTPVFLAKQPPAPARGPAITAITADGSGHFTASALVNGVHVDMLADTGATVVVLTPEDAERIGLDPRWLDYTIKMQTANGVSMAAQVMLDEISIGQVSVHDVRALVAKPDALAHSLLGMSFIGALSRFELKGDQLVLVQ